MQAPMQAPMQMPMPNGQPMKKFSWRFSERLNPNCMDPMDDHFPDPSVINQIVSDPNLIMQFCLSCITRMKTNNTFEFELANGEKFNNVNPSKEPLNLQLNQIQRPVKKIDM